jgi:hypothetical protein
VPVISVDTKHKELIGDFKNPGQTWVREPIEVNAHDFPQDALFKAAPYGVYDVGRNHGFVHVGISSDTPQIADAFNLKVTVCHFPSGASKWNPVEHRLFGLISCHWAGIPLRSLELLLQLIRTTVTDSGLKVCARLTCKTY